MKKQESFNAPEAVRNAARRGLELRDRFDRGGLSTQEAGAEGIGSGVARARDLAGGDNISLATVRRMHAFFERHEQNNRPREREADGGPTAGTIAWLLWGGNPGRRWAASVVERADDDVEKYLKFQVKEHNSKNSSSSQKTNIQDVREVYKRAVQEGQDTPLTRVNSFMRLLRVGRSGNVEYTQDNDLLPLTHKKSTRTANLEEIQVLKTDDELGVVFGYAIVCKSDGIEYYDTQGDYIPEEAMLKASFEFMSGPRIAKDTHAGEQIGQVVFAFPLTKEIADALDIEVSKTGLIIGMKPDDKELLNKYKTGEYTGFSIGGRRIVDTEVT